MMKTIELTEQARLTIRCALALYKQHCRDGLRDVPATWPTEQEQAEWSAYFSGQLAAAAAAESELDRGLK